MDTITLHDWNKLSIDDRKSWLEQQTPYKLTELLQVVSDMITDTDKVSNEMSILIEPSDIVINARDFTYSTLREVETYIIAELRTRNTKLCNQAANGFA